MTSVAPPPASPPLPAGTALAPQLTLTLTSAPLALSQMALDSLINGLVKSVTPQGTTVLQTNLGNLEFKSPFMLPEGTNATFKLVQTEPTLQIQLNQINGKLIPMNTSAARVTNLAAQFMQNTPGNVMTGGPALQNTLTGAIANPDQANLNLATGMRAFVLSNNPNQPLSLNMGAMNAGQVIQGSNTPNATSAPFFAQTGLAQNQGANQASSPSMGQNPALQGVALNNNAPFQTGNQLSVRLLSVQLPGQAQMNTPETGGPSDKNIIIKGSVQGMTGASQPIIKTPHGFIALDTTTRIPEGALIRLELLSSTKPAHLDAKTTNILSPSQSLSKSWPALEETLKVLSDINPVATEHLSNTLIVRPDMRMAANMMFFLKALGRGNISNWADDSTLRAIGKAKPGLLKKLEEDFTTLSKKSKEPTSTDWRIAYVPIQDDSGLHQIRIAQRDHQDEKEGDKEDAGTRFIIDIELTQMGEMQFDGLAKDRSKKFDLIIRTHSTLAGHFRKDIHDIFENSMKAVGFEGNIIFQVTSHFINVEGMEIQAETLNLGMLV
jgi:hypothetical protein